MHFIWNLIILGLSISFCFNLANSNKCGSETEVNCDDLTSEYEKYRACMEKRTKRSADCYGSNDNCGNCNCDLCENSASCNTCNNCCSQCCNTRMCSSYTCCHEDCKRECKSHACKTSCKKSCQDKESLVKSVYDGSFNYSQNIKNENHHNITTIIHLNNVINNTNLINVPITVNNTVYNNITNKQADESYSYYIENRRNITGNQSQNQNQKCCLTIGPRQCVSDEKFPFIKCFHIRKHVCGAICVAPIMHFEKHEICDNDVNNNKPCKEQTIFIPQPKPRCAYNPNWPYVNCGNNGYTPCEGCYNAYIKREDVGRCSHFCYDDGFGIGPYYRQGPFYRPEYSPVPSCYQIGTCPYPGRYSNFINQPSYELPFNYPQAPYPYPYAPPNCENCPQPNADNFIPVEPIINVDNENIFPAIEWDNVPEKDLRIDSAVTPLRSERYAEIKIQTSDNATTTGGKKKKKS